MPSLQETLTKLKMPTLYGVKGRNKRRQAKPEVSVRITTSKSTFFPLWPHPHPPFLNKYYHVLRTGQNTTSCHTDLHA